MTFNTNTLTKRIKLRLISFCLSSLTSNYLLFIIKANIFVHFIPVDHNEMNEMDQSAAAAAAATAVLEDISSSVP